MASTKVGINLEASVSGAEQVKKLKEEIKAASKEAEKVAKEFGDSSEQAKKAAEKVAKLNGQLGGFKTIKQQIKEATAEAVLLAREFGEFSPEATAAAQKVAKLKDEMGDFQQRVAGLNPDKFQAIAGVTQGIAGGISAATGAMALFGAESEDAQKTLAKVQGAIAFSQGVQQLLDMRNSFGAMATTIKTQVITAFTTLKGAVMATGIGLLAVGVAALIANFDKVSEWISKSWFGKLAKGIGEAVTAVTDFLGVTSQAERDLEKMTKANKKANDTLSNQIDVLTALGGKEKEVYALKKQQAENELNILRATLKAKGKLTEEELKQFNDLKAQQQVLTIEFNKQQKDAAKKASDEQTKAAQETAKKNQELAEQRKQNQLEINATMLALDQSTLDAQIKAADAAFATKVTQLKNQGYTEKQIATLRDAELEKVRTAFYDKQKADTDKANKEREDQLKEAREKEIAGVKKATEDYFIAKQTEYIQRNATQAEFDALELQRLQKQLADAKKYNDDTVQLEKDIAAKKKDIYDKDKKAKEDAEKAKRAAEIATLESASSIIGSLGQLFGQSEKEQKAFGLAQIAVDTARALTSAQANATSPTADNIATGGVAGFAKYAAYVAIILSNVARAKALIKGSGGGGGGGGAGAAPAAPSFAPTVGGGLPDEQQFGGMGRVYVLEGDITKTQTRVRRLRNTSVV